MRRVFSTATNVAVFVEDKVPRALKKMSREITIARQCYEDGTGSSLRKLLNIVRKSHEGDEASSRVSAYGAALAMKLNRLEDSELCLAKATQSPPVIQRSLRVLHLTKAGKYDEALDEVEKVLNEEDVHFHSINSHLSDQALDELHHAIKENSDSNLLMKRFRRIQKALTQFDRRTESSIDVLLATPLALEGVVSDRGVSTQIPLTEKVIAQTPHFLSGDVGGEDVKKDPF